MSVPYICSANNNVVVKRVLVVEKHRYKMTKGGLIRTILLVFPTKFHLLYKHKLCDFLL